MGHLRGDGDAPLGAASTLRIAETLKESRAIGIADPTRTGTDHSQRVDAQPRSGKFVALKGCPGRLHHGPESPGYRPYLGLPRDTIRRSTMVLDREHRVENDPLAPIRRVWNGPAFDGLHPAVEDPPRVADLGWQAIADLFRRSGFGFL